MARNAWFVVLCLLVLPLAGCFDQGGSEDPAVQRGDFVRVHYVARYASNGTVIDSTYNGTWPAGQDLADVPADEHLPQQLWYYMWTQASVQNETGRGIPTTVNFRDLDADGFRETMVQTREDLLRENGTSVRENANTSMFHVPPNVTGDPNIPLDGVYEVLVGTEEGQLLQDVEIPPGKAYGEEDPNRIRSIPREQHGRSRNLTDRPLGQVMERSNMTEETEEGDRISYRLFNSTAVPANVTDINRSADHVSLYIHVEEGIEVTLPDLWPATVINVTRWTYGLEHNPTVGDRYPLPGNPGVTFLVEDLNATHMRLNFNDPRAGETIVYDIKVLDVVRPTLDGRLYRGRTVDPFRVDNAILDVGMLSQGTVLAGTEQGIFLTTDFGRSWYPFDRSLAGRQVRAVEVSDHEPGEVWLAVEGGGLLHTTDVGFGWEQAASAFGGPVDAVAQSPTTGDLVYAVVRGDGVYRSTDRGGNWTKMGGDLTEAQGLAVDATDDDALWAATATGLRRSTDRGATWDVAAFHGRDVTDVDTVDNDTAYALVDGGFNITRDGGQTWNASGGAGRQFVAIAHAQRNPNRMIAANRTATLFLSQNLGGVFVPLQR